MPINEKTASFYHYFEPLYHVIHDLPRPPDALLNLRQGESVWQEYCTTYAVYIQLPDLLLPYHMYHKKLLL